jgi:predicted PurR-regulated permease PerM
MSRKVELLIPRQRAFWLLIAAGFILLVWLLSGMLLPFVLGMALAYVMAPIADRLERLGLPRWLATLLLLGITIGTVVLALVLVLPLLIEQATQLIQQIPHYVSLLRHRVLPQITSMVAKVGGPKQVASVQNTIMGYAGDLSTWVLDLLGHVWSGGLAIANIFYVLLLTPLVAFYFLRDWHKMLARLNLWMPRQHAGDLRAIAREIDSTLAGFIRGQAIVSLIFATYYSVALSLAGLDFAIIIGTAAGILTFIPYLGAALGLIASVIVAFVQFSDHTRVLIVAGVYLLGHLVEGNVVTPTLVGDRVKLHPMWIIFALMAGGALFGFTGVLLAVPVAAVTGVLVRFGLRQYLASGFYDDVVVELPVADSVEPANASQPANPVELLADG